MTPIPYILKRRAWLRVLRFAVHADGRFVVTAPVLLGKGIIEKMIEEKREWILEKLNSAKRNPQPVRVKRSRKEVADDKRSALCLVNDRIVYFNLHYRLTWNRIAIRNQQSRWGSCSSKKNLNFHYKITLLPPHLADYLIVHELCHLAQMNHSPQFWDLVAQTIPDWQHRRKEIREHENRLR